ncbi:unnamed protein product [Spirodela intermedia]|uniref:Transcription factor MYC/MYB N-terminal domain-containing protein n=1 Tax=Spirodela intermedia TaxID=51605 RepID=A0A7I8L697_SPIIN|nr:unnamed protein product [Spirodela intermedia]
MGGSGELQSAAGGGVVGEGGRSKEAMGMVALHEALRNVCRNFDWTYSVFWTIRPRPRCRGGNGCKVGDDNGSLMLMWEDGYCRTRAGEADGGEDPVRKAFSKMSIQLYNYGEGLMGKVASDKCHKWVFKEPSSSSSNDCEPGIANYWQSSFDALPSEWTDQFASGIQTIAVIQAGHGLLQLGSCKIIPEDLHFVLRMRHTFESLGYQSSYYFSTIFSSSSSSSSAAAAAARAATSPSPSHSFPSHLFNWSTPPLAPASFHHAAPAHVGFSEGCQMDDPEIKWPTGLSFFNALTSRADDAELLFGGAAGEALGTKAAATSHRRVVLGGNQKPLPWPYPVSTGFHAFISLKLTACEP